MDHFNGSGCSAPLNLNSGHIILCLARIIEFNLMAAWIHHVKSCLLVSNLPGQGETASITMLMTSPSPKSRDHRQRMALVYSNMYVYRYQIPQVWRCFRKGRHVHTYMQYYVVCSTASCMRPLAHLGMAPTVSYEASC